LASIAQTVRRSSTGAAEVSENREDATVIVRSGRQFELGEQEAAPGVRGAHSGRLRPTRR